MVQRAEDVVPSAPISEAGMPRQQGSCIAPSVTEATCLEFLRAALSHFYLKPAVESMLSAHHPSSVRQYQSCWKRFQHFLELNYQPQVTVVTVLEFLAWLADSSNRAPATVSEHYAALADPLRFGLGVLVPKRELSLLIRGIRAC